MEILQSRSSCAAPYLCVSVEVLLSSCACWRPLVCTAVPSYMGMHLYCGSELLSLCVSMEKRRDQGSESPLSRQPHLAHLLVSPTYPGHSSQPLSNRRPGSEHSGGGWEVLAGLKHSWNSEQSSYSSYMSTVASGHSASLGSPPAFSLCMGISLCVRVSTLMPAPPYAVCEISLYAPR